MVRVHAPEPGSSSKFQPRTAPIPMERGGLDVALVIAVTTAAEVGKVLLNTPKPLSTHDDKSSAGTFSGQRGQA
jgi:hypothetical protein